MNDTMKNDENENQNIDIEFDNDIIHEQRHWTGG